MGTLIGVRGVELDIIVCKTQVVSRGGVLNLSRNFVQLHYLNSEQLTVFLRS
jgi:hypothetical protein